ncbi:MAG: lysozyme, partial [Solimonas sp.]
NKAYLDPTGIVTICNGHTGPDVQLGQQRSDAECEALAMQDLLAAHADVQRCIRTPLSEAERNAYADLAFNIGGARFCASTLVGKANAGDRAGACAELSRWDRAGGQRLLGLSRRRAAERALCEAGVP